MKIEAIPDRPQKKGDKFFAEGPAPLTVKSFFGPNNIPFDTAEECRAANSLSPIDEGVFVENEEHNGASFIEYTRIAG